MTAMLVHVVDDDAAVRGALRWLLEGEGFAVRDYASAEAFLEARDPRLGGCAVVDLRMPGMSGLELQDALARRGDRMPLVFLTAHGEIPLAVAAMRAGAVDFVEKPFDDEQLLEAIRRALQPQPPVAGRAPDAAQPPAPAARLSERERDVIAGVVAGKSSKVIAGELGIATKTVEAHRARIMAKLGTRSLAALVRLVVQHRLLER